MKTLLLAGLIGFWATSVMAHSPLESTAPANDAIVVDVPSEVIFKFKNNIRLTRISMTHEDHPSVDLDLSAFSAFSADYAVPMDPMGAGIYVIDWRGLGADGHAVTGSFNFTVEE